MVLSERSRENDQATGRNFGPASALQIPYRTRRIDEGSPGGALRKSYRTYTWGCCGYAFTDLFSVLRGRQEAPVQELINIRL